VSYGINIYILFKRNFTLIGLKKRATQICEIFVCDTAEGGIYCLAFCRYSEMCQNENIDNRLRAIYSWTFWNEGSCEKELSHLWSFKLHPIKSDVTFVKDFIKDCSLLRYYVVYDVKRQQKIWRICSSETSVDFQRTIWQVPKESTLHNSAVRTSSPTYDFINDIY
jgi:hypothetical protein